MQSGLSADTRTLCRTHPSQACSLAVGRRRRANDSKRGKERKKNQRQPPKNKNSKWTNYLATISICSSRQSPCFDKAALSGEANLKQHPSCRRLAGATRGGRPRRRRSESPTRSSVSPDPPSSALRTSAGASKIVSFRRYACQTESLRMFAATRVNPTSLYGAEDSEKVAAVVSIGES